MLDFPNYIKLMLLNGKHFYPAALSLYSFYHLLIAQLILDLTVPSLGRQKDMQSRPLPLSVFYNFQDTTNESNENN